MDLGQCLLYQRRYDEAIAPLGTALQITPNKPYSHYYLGKARNRTGKCTEARQQWQTAAQSGEARVTEGAQKQFAKYP